MNMVPFLLSLATTLLATVVALEPCPGETRGNKKCNFDSTHRVCAKIGVPDTSFWRYTGQELWCNTREGYYRTNGKDIRCPADRPMWCIGKWAAAKWIKGQGCDNSIEFDCDATDICDVRYSYIDYGHDMKPAHQCLAKKCKAQWDACEVYVDVLDDSSDDSICKDRREACKGWAKSGYCQYKACPGWELQKWVSWMAKNCKKSCGKCIQKKR